MAATKYEHLIKPLSTGAINWDDMAKQNQESASLLGPGSAKKEIWLNGRDHLEGLPFNFSWGVHNELGDWHAGSKAHVHPYPECLFFVGLDTANVNYLGAEIECCLGNEREAYTFNDPTVVVIPAGLPHGPISTKRLFSPKGFGFFAADLSDAFSIAWLEKDQGAEAAKATGKYAHLVKSLKPGLIIERGKFIPSRLTPEQLAQREEMQKKTVYKAGPGNADHLTCMFGKDLGGMNVNIAWGFFSQPGIWQRGVNAHRHPANEVMIFLGADPNNDDYLGAEIEFDLGKEHERHFFNKPSAVICPAGLPHAPIITRWADRPFAVISINLAGDETMSFA